jgi:hypothetical protein
MKTSDNLALMDSLKESLANNSVSSEVDRLWIIRRIAELESTLPKQRPTHHFKSREIHPRPNSRCIHCGKTSRHSIHF